MVEYATNMKNAVEVKNLSKLYVIGEKEKYLALRDVIIKILKAPVNILKGKGFKKKSTFWALKDVNFNIKEGEVVGIIGRNGAGKSTLLKVLSRITEPTEGSVRMNGRVSSLLEVGTGFHPELTGRENIYLNGAILGMSRKEIDKKFKEIVEFSGVEKFLDMPVKRYSSGMQVRLAFSVAAHLEPDILIIDEVLAVGDAEFQKKCLGKMDEVTKSGGRTVIFVSHDMGAIQRLCKNTILLEGGEVTMIGETEKVIRKYMAGADADLGLSNQTLSDRPGNKKWIITELAINNLKGDKVSHINTKEKFSVVGNVENKDGTLEAVVGVILKRDDGLKITKIFSSKLDSRSDVSFELEMENVNLSTGTYYFSIWLGSPDGHDVYDYAENILKLEVLNENSRTMDNGYDDGVISIKHKWQYE